MRLLVLGVKLAAPERGSMCWRRRSYLMIELRDRTSVQLGLKLIIVVVDNGGFGCIDRLQRSAVARRQQSVFQGFRRRFCAHAADSALRPRFPASPTSSRPRGGAARHRAPRSLLLKPIRR